MSRDVGRVVGYRSFGTATQSKEGFFDCLILEDGTDKLFQNVDNQLQIYAS
jgi:hypothetical protein